jgi:hypothetical protein
MADLIFLEFKPFCEEKCRTIDSVVVLRGDLETNIPIAFTISVAAEFFTFLLAI